MSEGAAAQVEAADPMPVETVGANESGKTEAENTEMTDCKVEDFLVKEVASNNEDSSTPSKKRKADERGDNLIGCEVVLNCPNCGEGYDLSQKKPLLAPCLHTLCTSCAVSSIAKENPPRLVCPCCQADHANIKSADDLQPNSELAQKLAPADPSTSVLELAFTSCGLCDNRATHKCSQCPDGGEFLCEFHVAEHVRQKVTKSHTPVEIVISATTPGGDPEELQICEEHKEKMNLYCESCSECICVACLLKQHPKPSHNVGFLNSIDATKHRKGLTAMLATTIRKLEEVVNPSIAKIDAMIVSLDTKQSSQMDVIKGVTKKLHDEVEMLELRMKSVLEEEIQNRKKVLLKQRDGLVAVAGPMQEIVAATEATLSEKNDKTFLSLKGSVLKRNEKICKGVFAAKLSANDDFRICERQNALDSIVRRIPDILELKDGTAATNAEATAAANAADRAGGRRRDREPTAGGNGNKNFKDSGVGREREQTRDVERDRRGSGGADSHPPPSSAKGSGNPPPAAALISKPIRVRWNTARMPEGSALTRKLTRDAKTCGGNLQKFTAALGSIPMSSGAYAFAIRVTFTEGNHWIGVAGEVDGKFKGSFVESRLRHFSSGDVITVAVNLDTRKTAFSINSKFLQMEQISVEKFKPPLFAYVGFDVCTECSATFVDLIDWPTFLMNKIKQ